MSKKRSITLIVICALILVIGLLIPAYPAIKRSLDDRIPKYETGQYTSAKVCAECHPGVHDEWSKYSGHAVANSTPGYKKLYDAVGDEAICSACHGPKELKEGVSCVNCHGLVIPGKDIEYTHEAKFKPGLKELSEPKFCSKCHDHMHPLTGEYYRETYAEWKGSPAAKDGTTCVDCHMKEQGGDKKRYHGQNAAFRNLGRYKDYLVIKEVKLDFPMINLAVENRVMGHKMPTGGPQRTLALHLRFMDKAGKEIHKIDYKFNQVFSDFFLKKEIMWKEIQNTKLQAGETRQLSFTLPAELKDSISKVNATLEFYGIVVFDHGELDKAVFHTEPIAQTVVDVAPASGM